jgi:hypothetical protein
MLNANIAQPMNVKTTTIDTSEINGHPLLMPSLVRVIGNA